MDDNENKEVIDFTEADKEIGLILNELDKEEAELLAYYQNKQNFDNMANKMETEIASNNEELAKIEELLESHKQELEQLNEGSASNLLDNVMKEVTNTVLSPLGINASEFDEVIKKVERDNSNYENRRTDVAHIRAGHEDIKKELRKEGELSQDGNNILFEDEYAKNKEYVGLKANNKDRETKEYSTNNVNSSNNSSQAGSDHIVSANEIQNKKENYLGGMSDDDRVNMANDRGNLAYTSKSKNSSMSDNDIRKWMDKPSNEDPSKTNAEYFNVDKNKVNKKWIEAKVNQSKHIGNHMFNDYKNNAKSMLVKHAKAVFLMELAKAFIKAFKEAFKEKALSLLAKIKKFGEELWNGIKDVFKRLSSILAQIFGSTINNLANQITSHVIGFMKNLAKQFFKPLFMVFDAVVGAIKILFSKASWQEKIEAIAKLAILSVVNFGIIKLVEVLPLDEDSKDIITMILMAIASAVVIYWLDGFNRNKKQAEIESKKLIIAEQEQGKNALLARNCTLHVALAMTSTGQTVSYFQYAFTDIMRGYGKVLNIVDEMKDNMNEHNRKMECLDYESNKNWQEAKDLDNELEQLRKQREGEK